MVNLFVLSIIIGIHCFDLDSSSTASSTVINDTIKISPLNTHRATKKHYKSLNTLSDHQHATLNINNDHPFDVPILEDESKPIQQHRSSTAITSSLLQKGVSNSIADLSSAGQNHKVSSATIRLSSFQSKLDQCFLESYKKVPLSQSFDWGILAVTNTDLILLYNKDKSSLVVFDAHGHENEVGARVFYATMRSFRFI
jgi:hypothetical protein